MTNGMSCVRGGCLCCDLQGSAWQASWTKHMSRFVYGLCVYVCVVPKEKLRLVNSGLIVCDDGEITMLGNAVVQLRRHTRMDGSRNDVSSERKHKNKIRVRSFSFVCGVGEEASLLRPLLYAPWTPPCVIWLLGQSPITGIPLDTPY